MPSIHDQFGHGVPTAGRRAAVEPQHTGVHMRRLPARRRLDVHCNRAVVPLGVRCDGLDRTLRRRQPTAERAVCGGARLVRLLLVPLMRIARVMVEPVDLPSAMLARRGGVHHHAAALLRLRDGLLRMLRGFELVRHLGAAQCACLLRLRVPARIPFEHGAVAPAHMPAFEHDALRACRVDEFDVVRHQHADAVTRAHRVRDGLARGRVHMVRRLVEHQHVRIGEQRARHLQTLALAAGERGEPVGPVVTDAERVAQRDRRCGPVVAELLEIRWLARALLFAVCTDDRGRGGTD